LFERVMLEIYIREKSLQAHGCTRINEKFESHKYLKLGFITFPKPDVKQVEGDLRTFRSETQSQLSHQCGVYSNLS